MTIQGISSLIGENSEERVKSNQVEIMEILKSGEADEVSYDFSSSWLKFSTSSRIFWRPFYTSAELQKTILRSIVIPFASFLFLLLFTKFEHSKFYQFIMNFLLYLCVIQRV